MEKERFESLFSEFKPIREEEWYNLAQKEIKKTDLTWQMEELELKPLYTRRDIEPIAERNIFQHNQNNGWLLVDKIEVTDEATANVAALNSLSGGSDGIQFILKNKKNNLHELLKDIWLDNCIVAVQSPEPDLCLKTFLTYYKDRGYSAKDLRGWIAYNSFKFNFLEDDSSLQLSDNLDKLFNISSEFPNYRCLIINSGSFANAGVSIVQEVAYCIAYLVDILEELNSKGVRYENALSRALFMLTVSTNFFFEISKLRAFRVLVKKIFLGYGLNIDPSEIAIHCESSVWNKSCLDWENNIIRNGAEAMAAIIGGCNFLTVTDHGQHRTSDKSFSQRISRNISHVLKEEAYIGKVSDPAAGSYYIESLTREITEKSWELFLKIEKEGGFTECLKKGWIKKEVEKARNSKIESLELRKEFLIGVNIFPNLKEEPVPATDENKSAGRLTEGIESLRSWVENKWGEIGSRPKVVISNFRKDPIDKVNQSFLRNVFSSAGFFVEFHPDLENLYTLIKENQLEKNILILAYLKEEDVSEKESFLEKIARDFPVILTSMESLEIKKDIRTHYLPLNKLALSKNLKNILTNLNKVKK